MSTPRRIIQILSARPSTDGDGVRIQRTIGQNRHDMDPFLMVDEIRSENRADYVGGFPPHPHRGIETLTYMIAGGFVHEDSMGHRAELRDGGAQWMSAGRGVIHSELPLIQDGLLHGFQLWINLAASQKMKPAAYKQAAREELPTLSLSNGAVVRSFGGSWQIEGHMLTSPLADFSANARTLDVILPANGTLAMSLPSEDTVLAYVFEGSLASTPIVGSQQLARFSQGEQLVLQAGEKGARLLLLAGTALQEPIVQYGPFVMNTETEIQQAIDDYRNNRLV